MDSFGCGCVNRPSRAPPLPTLVPEFETLVLARGKSPLAQQRTRCRFRGRPSCHPLWRAGRWFADKGSAHITARLKATIPLGDPDGVLELVNRRGQGRRETAEYVLPARGEMDALRARAGKSPRARGAPGKRARRHRARRRRRRRLRLAAARQGPQVGRHRGGGDGGLEFRPGGQARARRERHRYAGARDRHGAVEHTALSQQYVVNSFFSRSRPSPGINPEIEIGRFLTDSSFHNHSPPLLLGTVELVEEDPAQRAPRSSMASARTRGRPGTVTSAYLDRLVEERLLAQRGPGGKQRAHGLSASASWN